MFPPLHTSCFPKPSKSDSNTIANCSYPYAGARLIFVLTADENDAEQYLDSQFHPFDSEEVDNFAEQVTSNGLPANVIGNFLNGKCSLKVSVRNSLKSNYCLQQKINAMEASVGHGFWKKSTLPMA
jgi:hypothetical protein